MTISINAEGAFNKIQYLLIIKTLSKIQIKLPQYDKEHF